MGATSFSYWPTDDGRAAAGLPLSAADTHRCLVGSVPPEWWCPRRARPGELMCDHHDPGGQWHRAWVGDPDTHQLRAILAGPS